MAPDSDRDVVVVGGGASGLSAAVFLARYGFDVLAFDRGKSAIRRCYSLENYLGFLAIDPETFLELGREHVRYEGGEIVDDMVVDVAQIDGDSADAEEDGADADSSSDAEPSPDADSPSFRISTQDGRTVTTRYVVAAAAYDGDYLAALADGQFHEADVHPVEADDDGRTSVEGLYVAGWLSGGPHQVVIAAGHGARVAKALVVDHRKAQGYWDGVADYWDWRVEVGTYGDERWERQVDDWIDETIPEDEELSDERIERVRAAVKAERLDYQLSADERERRLEDGRELLRERLLDEEPSVSQ